MAVASWLPSDAVMVTGQWTFAAAPTFSTGVSIPAGSSLSSPTISGATLAGTFTGTYSLSGTPTITGAAFVGATTVASGAVFTTPRELWTANDITATGTTGSNAAAISAIYPGLVTATGASGAGVNLPTGAAVAGAFYWIKNMMTGDLKVYSTGATINGITGTTGSTITATGNKMAVVFCTVAGAWQLGLNT